MKKLIFLFIIALLAVSCASTQEDKKETSALPVVQEEDLPRIVAVLPFQNDTDEKGIANQVRKAFYNHFSSKPYRDVETSVIDEKIVHLEKSTGKSVLELKPADVCQAIGCDGLISGKVTDFKKVYAGLYSQLGVEAEVWMINTKTGKEVFRIKESVRYHEGTVPLSPLGLIMSAVSAAMNIREIQQVRLVNELAYKFNEKIPSPKGLTAEDRPLIKEVLTNAKESPFGKGKQVKVGLDGEPGAVALFDIGNFKKNIPMKEVKPGIYMGEYLVMPGDNAADVPVIAYLKRPGGLESLWIDVSGFIVIDTAPPSQVKGIKAKGFIDRIDISWDAIKNTPDLKEYSIKRSEQPLTGYVEVAKTETNTFEDKTAIADTVYYYRVTAFDSTGNESEMPDPVKASLLSKEPKILSGEITKDTILIGTYLVKKDVIVPKGMSLVIEPDTRILFEENTGLKIFGKITASAKDSPVEFTPAANKKWKGIFAENSTVSLSGIRVKDAQIGISLHNTDGIIENAYITESGTGILISGSPSAAVSHSTVSGNKTGLLLQKTDAKIFLNNIFQNTEGISAKGFSGEIRDNNIFDNEKNIISNAQLKSAPNYFGALNIDEMKLSNVTAAQTYDNKIPGGKIVNVISNPYLKLAPEEREKKAAEILVEAGNYFRQRNYGKAVTFFEEALKALPSAETYYYIAVCYQEMREDEKALQYLKLGVEKFPKDPALHKSLGMMYYQKGNDAEAKKLFEEVLRLNPEDRQVKFLLERMGK